MTPLIKTSKFILLFICSASYVDSTKFKFDSLVWKNTPQIIETLGYPHESHTIRTSDGILLSYFRIPFGKYAHNSTEESRIPVLLVHGLFASSYQWFLQVEGKNLALLLADAGYDVWLGNSRGVTYCTNLQNITAKDTAYWDFSVHEMGMYDLPAAIDYILDITKHKQLFYIGYSQGTTQYFISLSMKPQYNAKIRLAMMISPVAHLKNIRGIVKPLAYVTYLLNIAQIGSLISYIAFGDFLLSLALAIFRLIVPFICTVEPIQTICATILYSAVGFDYEQFVKSKWANVLSGLPDTTSIRGLAHYGQLIVKKGFNLYDHGFIKNLKEYGQLKPPSYNLSSITVPTAFFWSLNDYLCSQMNVMQLANEIPNIILNYMLPNPKYNHFDYIAGKDAFSLLYQPILRLMESYT